MLGVHGQVKVVRLPAVARDFSCKYPERFSGLPSLQSHAMRGLAQEVEVTKEANHSPPSRAEVNYERICTLSVIRRHDVHSGNLPTS
jgi:hypothetical protein